MILNLDQKTKFIQVVHDFFTGIIAIETSICSRFLCHDCIETNDLNLGQVMPQTYFKVIGIMCRSYFHHSGAKFEIDIVIGHNRHLTIDQGHRHRLAEQVFIACILWIHGYGSIA